MFSKLSIICFAVVLVGIILHCLISAFRKGWKFQLIDIIKKPIHLFTLLLVEQKLSLLGVLKKLVCLLALLCFLVLLITGFYPKLILGKTIFGYWMMLHATAAPVFAACLAFLAIMWAGANTFNSADSPVLMSFFRRVIKMPTPGEKTVQNDICIGRKICFWGIVFLSLPLILSVVLSMFPFFGTHIQELLLAVHSYTALLFTLVVIIHIYLTIQANMNE
ncbi:MAG: cytochrome b/b6 domain-containing protein [Planctomycetota bacterium]|jgi:cytochrome b subunit of formate dehydrogenase